MKAIANQVSAAHAPSEAAIRKGPHWDLSACCRFLDDDIIDFFSDEPETGKLLLTLSNAARVMLEHPQAKKRLQAAQDIIILEPECGLAHAVLAREGVDTYSEQNFQYRRAADFINWEVRQASDHIPAEEIDHDDHSLGSYILDEQAVHLIASEFANRLWKDGERDDAIEEISLSADLDDLGINLSCVQQFSWLMQCDREDDAAQLLHERRSRDYFWYYMNALFRFKQSGATPVSRAALTIALKGTDLIPFFLLEDKAFDPTKYSAAQDGDGSFSSRVKHCEEFADRLRCAWHHVSGSLPWLDQMRRSFAQRYFGKSESNGAGHPADKTREKRWLDNIDLADKYLEREQFKDAKSCLRMALRDAERMPIDGHHYSGTLARLAEFYEIIGEPPDAILNMVRDRVQLIEKQLSDQPYSLALSLVSLSNALKSSGDEREQIAVLSKAGAIFDQLASTDSEDSNLVDRSEVAELLALAHGQLRNYEESERLFSRAVEYIEQYLGKDHPHLIGALDHRARCLHILGRHEEERQLHAQIDRCRESAGEGAGRLGDDEEDSVRDFDEHAQHGPKCAWYVDARCR